MFCAFPWLYLPELAMSGQGSRTVLSGEEIARSLTRLAHEILEKNPDTDGIILLGIATRGVPLAQRLASIIEQIKGVRVPCGTVDITFHRDDFEQKGPNLNASITDIPDDLTGKTVVLVDDVLFTGRTIKAAMDEVMENGRPGKIQLAVLLDRGHRELPIRADYVGKNIPTSLDERVCLNLQETDGDDMAFVTDKNDE